MALMKHWQQNNWTCSRLSGNLGTGLMERLHKIFTHMDDREQGMPRSSGYYCG